MRHAAVIALCKRAVRGFLFSTYLCLTTLSLLYLTYLIRRESPKITEVVIPENLKGIVSEEFVHRVGFLKMKGSPQGFWNFPLEKPKGRIRVGCFGDSFTAGTEVEVGGDYPTYLSKLLQKQGMRNFEVLNFGNSFHGLHQAFMIWEELGKKYDLDYVLLGPTIFRPERDRTFGHIPRKPEDLHSRYILDNENNLRRIDIPGRNKREIFENYHRFFPLWEVAQYDVQSPPSLRALLPKGRTFKNPFYYTEESAQVEDARIFEKMRERISSSGAKLVVVDPHLGEQGFDSFNYKQVTRFPYLAPRGHNSSIGNQQVAGIFFSLLTGKPYFERGLSVRDSLVEEKTALEEKFNLKDYDEVVFFSGLKKIAQFSNNSNIGDGDPQVFKKLKVNSILTLRPAEAPLIDSVWIPLQETIHSGDSVDLVWKSGKSKYRRNLGKIELLNPGLGIGYVSSNNFTRLSENEYRHRERIGVRLEDGDFTKLETGLYLNSKRVAEIEVVTHDDRSFAVLPGKGEYFAIRASERRFSIDELLRNKTVDLELLRGKERVRVPFAELSLE